MSRGSTASTRLCSEREYNPTGIADGITNDFAFVQQRTRRLPYISSCFFDTGQYLAVWVSSRIPSRARTFQLGLRSFVGNLGSIIRPSRPRSITLTAKALPLAVGGRTVVHDYRIQRLCGLLSGLLEDPLQFHNHGRCTIPISVGSVRSTRRSGKLSQYQLPIPHGPDARMPTALAGITKPRLNPRTHLFIDWAR